MKQIFVFLFALTLFAAEPRKIAVQNTILTTVNGTTISVLDVKKKLDLFFYQNYPQLAESAESRLQFYEMSWRKALVEMINQELIVADATDKEIKLTDGEVREEMGRRFGPNIMRTLDRVGLNYDEAWKMVRNEMIVQRMNFWFIHMKAEAAVTPQDIRNAYQKYLAKNPAYSELTYKIVSIKMDEANEQLANEVYEYLTKEGKDPSLVEEKLKVFNRSNVAVSISKPFKAKEEELSVTHRDSLADLNIATFGKPSFQVNRIDGSRLYRIFYLADRVEYQAVTFEAMTPSLKADLIQHAAAKESHDYYNRLHKRYNVDAERVAPADLHPFSLQ